MATNEFIATTAVLESDICAGKDLLWQTHAFKQIELYAYPVVIVGGTLCNVIAIVVLQTATYRGTPTGFLMTALATADTGLLLTGILRRWVKTVSGTDVRLLSPLGCKTNVFFTYVFQYVSAWTLALITIERAVCVYTPFRCRELCSLKRIVAAWVVLVVGMIAINVHFFWTYGILWDSDWEEYDCTGAADDVFLYGGAQNWLDFLIPCLLPFFLILSCNLAIVAKLAHGAGERKKMVSGTAQAPKQTSTTVMLLFVSVMFLLMTTPFAIFAISETYLYWPYNNPTDCANLDFVYSFFYLLFNMNSAVNFLLYCMSGSKFRSALRGLLFGGKGRKRTSSQARSGGDGRAGVGRGSEGSSSTKQSRNTSVTVVS